MRFLKVVQGDKIIISKSDEMNPGDEKKKASSPMEDHSLPSLAYSPNLVPGSYAFPGRRLK